MNLVFFNPINLYYVFRWPIRLLLVGSFFLIAMISGIIPEAPETDNKAIGWWILLAIIAIGPLTVILYGLCGLIALVMTCRYFYTKPTVKWKTTQSLFVVLADLLILYFGLLPALLLSGAGILFLLLALHITYANFFYFN